MHGRIAAPSIAWSSRPLVVALAAMVMTAVAVGAAACRPPRP